MEFPILVCTVEIDPKETGHREVTIQVIIYQLLCLRQARFSSQWYYVLRKYIYI